MLQVRIAGDETVQLSLVPEDTELELDQLVTLADEAPPVPDTVANAPVDAGEFLFRQYLIVNVMEQTGLPRGEVTDAILEVERTGRPAVYWLRQGALSDLLALLCQLLK